MTHRRTWYWRATVVAVFGVSILSFTPVVLDPVDADPLLFGMPHTLWASMAIAFALVFLTWVGTRVYDQTDDAEDAA